MPRSIQNSFKNGMITDVVGAPESLFLMRDFYLRRPNELCSRSPVHTYTQSNVEPTARFHDGFSEARFHPNFGVGAVRGSSVSNAASDTIWDADEYQLMGAALEGDAATGATVGALAGLSFAPVTENGAGSTKSSVCTAYNAGTASWYPMERCEQSINTGSEMVFAGIEGRLFKWGGSQLPAYATGSVATAASDRIITGTGTTWSTNIEAGQYILIDTIGEKASNNQQRAFRITRVHSNTQLEIETPMAGVASGLSYRVQSVACLTSPDGVWNATDEFPRTQGILAYWQDKLWVAGTSNVSTDYNTVYDYDNVMFSGTVDESSGVFRHMDLWHTSANFNVFGGIGGRIMGLVPMGNSLIVIKAHAMFRITGKTAYDGTGDGYRVDMIDANVGATSRKSFVMTKAGLVIASVDGLYLYNEQEGLVSLTDGKVQRWWETKFLTRVFSVNATEDKVFVQLYGEVLSEASSQDALVWSIDGDYFWEMSSLVPTASIISCYSETDAWTQDYVFPLLSTGDVATNAGRLGWYYISNICHAKDFRTDLTDGTSLDSNPEIITQPLPTAADPVSEGRVNNVLLHALSLDGSTENIVSVLPGSTSPHFDITSVSTGEGTASENELEYTVVQGTTDRVHRIPVDASEAAPTCRLRVDASLSTEPNPYRVYAFGFEWEPTNVNGD